MYLSNFENFNFAYIPKFFFSQLQVSIDYFKVNILFLLKIFTKTQIYLYELLTAKNLFDKKKSQP